MDVRAKQRLSYHGSSETLACVFVVSASLISIVRLLLVNLRYVEIKH